MHCLASSSQPKCALFSAFVVDYGFRLLWAVLKQRPIHLRSLTLVWEMRILRRKALRNQAKGKQLAHLPLRQRASLDSWLGHFPAPAVRFPSSEAECHNSLLVSVRHTVNHLKPRLYHRYNLCV